MYEATLLQPEAAIPSGVRYILRKLEMPEMSWGGMLSLLDPDSDMITLDWAIPFLISFFSCRDLPVREYWDRSVGRQYFRMVSTTALTVPVPWLA